jgi:glutamine amidotransferase
MAVAPEFFENILGSTDSELMFHLALTFGLQRDPLQAMARMVGFVEEVGRKNNIKESVWMTIGLSDGETLYGFRYASDGQAPTLYYSPGVEELYKVNPEIKGQFGAAARAIVSEPIGAYQSMWPEVPQSSMAVVQRGEIDIRAFHPISG